MLEDLMSCLNANYGIKPATITLLPIGADLNASVYRVQTVDQTPYFIKLKRGHHHDISVDIVELLKSVGIQQVIPPMRTIHGKLTQPIGNSTLIVYPFIDGQDGFSRDLTDDQWIKLGKTLRQVHALAVPIAIQRRIRREAYSPQWREIVRSLYSHIETDVNANEIGLKLQQFMRKNLPAIRRLVDRAEQLGEKLRHQSPQFILCHSDIHAGNVLISRTGEIFIVDWDEPILAPKERDLMFIGGGVGNVWNKPREQDFFYQGYGKTEIDPIILAYYRHERIVEDIACYGQELLLTTRGANRSEMYKQCIDMFAPQGVVDIAFRDCPT